MVVKIVSQMEWTKDMTIRLIKLFKEKRVLWDPNVIDFKDRNKKHEAWAELGTDMDVYAIEVEKKVRMLIGQFQRELKKGKNGDGANAPYKSKWIFFKMLLFLKDKNERRHSADAGCLQTSSSQDIVQPHETKNCLLLENDGQPLFESQLEVQDSTRTCTEKNLDKNIPCISDKRMKRKADEIGKEEAYSIMKHVSNNFLKKRDEFDVFGEHVANTLRNLKNRLIQSRAKYEINNTLYQAEINDYNEQASCSTSDPSSLSSRSPILLDATPLPVNHSLEKKWV